MFLPFSLGLLHAFEPDHVAVVTGVSLEGSRRGAWKVGLAFGLSHMLAVAALALLSVLAGHALLGDSLARWLDRGAWAIVVALGFRNLAAAFGLWTPEVHAHPHRHGPLEHEHPHEAGLRHSFHHSAAWIGAFFGLGGVRGFLALARHGGTWTRVSSMLPSLLLFGLGITAAFLALSWAAGWIAAKLGTTARWRRILFGVSGIGNVAVGLWLLMRG